MANGQQSVSVEDEWEEMPLGGSSVMSSSQEDAQSSDTESEWEEIPLGGEADAAPQEDSYSTDISGDYNTLERGLIGAGRSFVETGQGIKQLGLQAGEALGAVEPETVEDYRQQIMQEQETYKAGGVADTTAAQFGEVVGDIAAAAPLAVAAPVTAGGAAIGLGGRAAIGAGMGAVESGVQPVYEEDYGVGKAKQVGAGAALGGAATYGIDKIAQFMPKNIMKNIYQKAKINKADVVNENELLQEVTGISMTPAEVSQNKPLQMLENLARQSIHTADELSAYDAKVARQGVKSVAKLAREISKPRKGAETVGIEVQKVVKDATDAAIESRRVMAKRDYNAIDTYTGNKPVVTVDNFKKELQSIVDDYTGIEGEDALKIFTQAKKQLENLDINKTSKQAVSSRSFYGNASKGTGNIFKDISPNLDRQIAGRLHRSLTDDLMESEKNPAVGHLFKIANDNYKNNSKSIEVIKESPLGKLLGKELDDAADILNTGNFNSIPGEQVIKKIMSLHPSEKRIAMKIIESKNPDVANAARRFVIQDALEKSLLPPSAGMQKGTLSFNKFLTNMQKSNIGAYGLKPDDIKQLRKITQTMEKIGDRSGLNMSGTQTQANMMGIAAQVGAMVTGSPRAAATFVLERTGLKRIAAAMTTKEGRDALEVVLKSSKDATKLERALKTIENISVRSGGGGIAEAGENIGDTSEKSDARKFQELKPESRQQWQQKKNQLLNGLGKSVGSEEEILGILMQSGMAASKAEKLIKSGNRNQIEDRLHRAKLSTLQR